MPTSPAQQIAQRINSLQAMLASSDTYFADLAAEQISRLEAQRALLEQLLARLAVVGKGLTLRHRSGKRWTVVLGDPSVPGAARHQTFDAFGFASHHTFPTLDEALAGAVDDGFITEDQGALERLSTAREWLIGSEITAITQAVNSGRLSFSEGHTQIAALRARLVSHG